MIKKIYIKPINKLIDLNKEIIRIQFEDQTLYRQFSLNLEQEIIYSINNEVVESSSEILRIINPFDLNINTKKNLNNLYKSLSKKIIYYKEKIINIERELFELFDDLSLEEEIALTYSTEEQLASFLSMYQLQFKNTDECTYLEQLVSFLKINYKFYKPSIVISNGIIELLTEEEKKLLIIELRLMSINIIDISLNLKNENVDYKIDSDWCVV